MLVDAHVHFFDYDAAPDLRWAWLESDERLTARRARRAGDELRSILVERIAARVRDACSGEAFDDAMAAVQARELDPWTATDALVDALGQ